MLSTVYIQLQHPLHRHHHLIWVVLKAVGSRPEPSGYRPDDVNNSKLDFDLD